MCRAIEHRREDPSWRSREVAKGDIELAGWRHCRRDSALLLAIAAQLPRQMSSGREPKDLELPQGSEVVAGSDLPRDSDELLKRPHAPVLIAPPNAPGIGRGSGATNPAWMSHDQPDAPPPKRRRGQTDVHTDANAREDGIHTAPDAPAPETARADTSAAAVGTAAGPRSSRTRTRCGRGAWTRRRTN